MQQKAVPRGRPREFDRHRALQRALDVFWRLGYDGASLATLTRAMRIQPPSLYAAFGSKEKLFIEAVDLYVAEHTGFMARALRESATARAGVERMLFEVATRYASGDHPHGCLVGTGMLSCAPRSRRAARALSKRRLFSLDFLQAHFDRAAARKELPRATDTRALASFYTAVVQGMSVQAIDGATIEQLESLAKAAMRAWPSGAS